MKGFAQPNILAVESKIGNTPIGDIILYLNKESKLALVDLDHATELLNISFSPQLEKCKVYQVKPKNGVFKNQIRRAVSPDAFNKIIRTAAKQGHQEAEKFQQDMVLLGMKQLGIKDGVLIDGVLIPRKQDGTLLYDFSINIPKEDLNLFE